MYIMERMTRYIWGELTEEEMDDFWVYLLKNPEEIDILETYMGLLQCFRHNPGKSEE